MSDDMTARLALPLLQAGQAQKEVTHNEALTALDLSVQATALDFAVNAPPGDPAPGECWVIGAAPTGDWTGHAGAVGGWTGGGWRFVAPEEGFAIWIAGAQATARFVGGAWELGRLRGDALVLGGDTVVTVRQAAISDPAGGTTIDAQARSALTAVLTALRAHGLVES